MTKIFQKDDNYPALEFAFETINNSLKSTIGKEVHISCEIIHASGDDSSDGHIF
jgi:hypothetical protein